MKRVLLVCMLLAVVVSVPAVEAQDPQTEEKIASAMSAAPAAVAQGATIMDYPTEEGGAFVVLREGSNGWTCFPDWQANPGNDPMCLDQTWMQWFDAIGAGTEPNITTVGLSYMLQGGSDASNTDPFATEPAPGEDWITSGPHVMLLSPVALDTTLFSTDHASGGPYVMWAGTPYEHIMMPVDVERLSRTDDKIASAMSAAPAAIAQGATIMDYPSEEGGAFVELRGGSNGWTCFPDWQANPGNDPMCLDQTWMQWSDAFAAGTEPNITTLGLSYMLQGGSDASNTDPFALEPAPGEDWVTSGPHVMLLSPVKLDTTLFSTDHAWGGPYVMWAGTPYEHIMMPVEAGPAAAAAAEAPTALPATGAEVGNGLLVLLVLTGLGLLAGGWLVRRRQKQGSHHQAR